MAETPSSPTQIPGTIYTFYSYKGGVGRSMALVNVGVLLALAGKRVLLIDWDLEAPGLEMYFRNSSKLVGDPESVPGIVDLLEARRANKELPWQKCLLRAEFLGKSLDVISAGKRTSDYRQRVQQLDWDSLYQEHQVGNFVDELREEWRTFYDFVLVDSRTGITDIGDICTVLLPDVLVLMFVTNYQNVEGVKQVMARAVAARKNLPGVNRAKLHAVPLPARDETHNEHEKSLEWRRIYAREFSNLYREWLPIGVTPEEVLNKLFIPYVTIWSFGERIPVLESPGETQNPTKIGAAYQRVANLLANGLDWYSLEARVGVEDLQSAQIELLREKERSRRTRRAFAAILAVALLMLAATGYWAYNRMARFTDGLAQLELVRDHRRTADPLREQGKLDEALDMYLSNKAIMEKLTTQEPSNTDWLQELALSNNRIGVVLADQGKLDEALAASRSYKAIMEKLTAQDPSNTGWQRELAVSKSRVGLALRDQGKLDEALAEFRSDMATMEKLTGMDSSNTGWQRDLAVIHSRTGEVLQDQGKLDEALAEYRSAKAIMDKLTDQDSSNNVWQADLALDHRLIGKALQAQNKLDESLKELAEAQRILTKLSAATSNNALWRRDLVQVLRLEASVQMKSGQPQAALRSVEEAQSVLRQRKIELGAEVFWQPETARVLTQRGEILQALGDQAGAAKAYDEARTLLVQLVKLSATNAEWKKDLARLDSLQK